MSTHKKSVFLLVLVMIFAAASAASAYNIPQDDSRAEYFYIFGPEGNPVLGAEPGNELLFYIDVPEEIDSNISISIYDPDTGGKIDYKANLYKQWDTVTEFTVYGAGRLALDSKSFDCCGGYDRRYFKFGPYSKTQGEKIGSGYRFKLRVTTTKGRDANLFNVRITPEGTEAFIYNMTIRLLPKEGEKMYFYPEVSEGTTGIVVNNYDMDPDGGYSKLYDHALGKQYSLKDSESGEWAQTVIPLTQAQSRRLQYVITKKTQRRAHAGLRFEDDKGNLLPIYFRNGAPSLRKSFPKEEVRFPEPKAQPQRSASALPCQRFIFDGTKSYDSDNQAFSYAWDFGDGTTSNESLVTHVFEKGGEYNVVLTVRDDSGLQCNTSAISQIIKVNTPPKPAFTCPVKACLDSEVTFDASKTEDNTFDALTYRWNFGDGTTAEGRQVVKAYSKAGTYKVSLTVDDNSGTSCSIASTEKYIEVKAPPAIAKPDDFNICIPASEEYRVNCNFVESKSPQDKNYLYTWDFGDGTVVTGKNVSHVYQKGGTYKGKFTVSESDSDLPCLQTTKTFAVNLNKMPVANAGGDTTACLGQDIYFDGSGSYDADGDTLTYAWDFGDGTANAQGVKVAHSYSKAGKYKAILTVEDGKQTKCSKVSDTALVAINTMPVASLAGVGPACIGKEVKFDASGSHDPDGDRLIYTWDFGDGVVTEGAAKTGHSYDKGGEYLVKVTVNDKSDAPCSSDSKSLKLRVNAPPIVDVGPNMVCCIETESVFDGSGSYDPDGDNLTYRWDFGDGKTAEGAIARHVYAKRGVYTVTLKVDDSSGSPCSSSTGSFTATVNEKPVAIMEVK